MDDAQIQADIEIFERYVKALLADALPGMAIMVPAGPALVAARNNLIAIVKRDAGA